MFFVQFYAVNNMGTSYIYIYIYIILIHLVCPFVCDMTFCYKAFSMFLLQNWP